MGIIEKIKQECLRHTFERQHSLHIYLGSSQFTKLMYAIAMQSQHKYNHKENTFMGYPVLTVNKNNYFRVI